MNRLTRGLDASIELGVVGILVFAPLPFGAVRHWSQAAIVAGVALVAALWLLRMLSAGELVLRRHPVLWPGLLMLGVVGLQLLVPGWSVSPYATGESARLYAAYLVLLVVLSGYLTTRARVLRLTWVIVAWGFVMALLGVVNYALGDSQLLWLPKGLAFDRLTATFLNPNHQALYFAICLFLAVGLLLRPRSNGGPHSASARSTGRSRDHSRPLWASVALLGFVLVLATALTLTLSRGGIVAALGGLVTLLVLLSVGRSRSRLPLLIIAGLAAFIAYATWVGMESVVARFMGLAHEPFADLRWAVWAATLRMAVEAPVLGIGLGGYQDAFTRFRPESVPVDKLVDFAHNDYLQLLAETGFVGFVAMLWALVGLGAFVVSRLLGRRDSFVKGLTMGAFCALAVAALHSLVDFGLHRPANALLVVVVAALLPAIVTWHQHRSGESVDVPAWRWTLPRETRVWGAGAVAVALALAWILIIPPGVADWKLQSALGKAGERERADGAVSLRELGEARRELEQAVWWDPRNPRALAALGEVLTESGARMWIAGVDADGRRLPDQSLETRIRATQGFFATAHVAFERSLANQPQSAGVHQGFGWLLGRLEGLRHAVRGSSITAADASLATLLRADDSLVTRGLAEVTLGAQLDPNNAPRFLSLARYALTFPVGEETSRRVAADAYRRALTIQPHLLARILDDLSARKADQDLLFESVPRNQVLRLQLAQYLEQRARWQAAWAAYEEAITLSAIPAQEVETRIAYGHALLRHGDRERAVSQARQALVIAPGNPEVFVLLGDAYEHLGQLAAAESAFTSAVTLLGPDATRRASRYRARLASFLAKHGQGDRAVALWRQVLTATPNDPWLRMELAYTLEQRGDASGALVEYQTASGLAKGDPLVQWELGRAMSRAGHLREAISAYEAAVSLSPREWGLRLELAELLVKVGARDRAVEQYRRILAGRPGHEGAQLGLARLAAVATDGG